MKITITDKYIAVEQNKETELFSISDIIEIENACLTIKLKIIEDKSLTPKEKAQMLALFCAFPAYLRDFSMDN